ncbi:hypothetical protein COO60DRAFT_1675442 [Scenedesmus sp. NREL 46B-D3]|nr:hypothetical protein COO60DRAFT_1675442 [Scenedesmus sp. NREL 46B-D3]
MAATIAIPVAKERSCVMMAEEDWNLEAGEMVEEVIKTQRQVAELLCSNNQATSELEAIKESCTQELEDLQADTWKLQLYAELERMRDHLELLAPLAADSIDSTGAARTPATTRDNAAGDSGGTEGSPKALAAAAGNSNNAVHGGFEHGELELMELDEEIASISAQLEQARQEMAGMMKAKQDLEREVGSVSEQMSAEVDAGELPSSEY